MRVLMLTLIDDPFDPPGDERIGGGHLFVLDLGTYLVSRGWFVTFLTRRNAPDKATHEQLGPRCTIERLAIGPASDCHPNRLLPHLDDLVAQSVQFGTSNGPFDVIHSHYWIAGVAARELARQIPTLHVHSVLSLGRKKAVAGEEVSAADRDRDSAEVRIFNEADRIVVTCPSEADDLRRLYPDVHGDNVRIIPYGADENVFFPRPEPPGDFVRRATSRIAKGTADVC
jgi:D-inositol-3-phosphate glycosyltransferase